MALPLFGKETKTPIERGRYCEMNARSHLQVQFGPARGFAHFFLEALHTRQLAGGLILGSPAISLKCTMLPWASDLPTDAQLIGMHSLRGMGRGL